MSLVTVVWSMIAAASLTLAAVHLPVWLRNHGARANLAFAIVATSTGVLSYFELRVLQAKTTTELADAMRWGHVPIAVLLAALAAFAHYYVDASWRALAIVAIGVRVISLVLDFTSGANLNFRQIDAVAKVPLL